MNDHPSPVGNGRPRSVESAVRRGEGSDYAVLLLDKCGAVLSWTADAQALYQYTAKEVVGLGFATLCPTGRSGTVTCVLDAARDQARAGWPVQHPVTGWCRRRDQTRFWAEVVATPLLDTAKTLLGFGVIVHDMTPRALTDEYSAILDSVSDSVIGINTSGRIVFVNHAVEAAFGYGRAELLGAEVEALVPPEQRGRLRSLLDPHEEVLLAIGADDTEGHSGRRPVRRHRDLAGLHRDGNTFPVEVTLTSTVTGQGFATTLVIRDMRPPEHDDGRAAVHHSNSPRRRSSSAHRSGSAR
jgi:PAS domain S-box-containing protein